MNIFSNFILNKFVTIDDKDPLWRKIKLSKTKKQKKTAFISHTFKMAGLILIITSNMILEIKFHR